MNITWTYKSNETRCGRVTINGIEHEIMMIRYRYNRGYRCKGYCWSYAFNTRVDDDKVTTVASGWVYDRPVASVTAKARKLARQAA